MKPRTFAIALGVALAILGVVLALQPTSVVLNTYTLSGAPMGATTVTCGGSLPFGVTESTMHAACAAAGTSPWIWALIGLGVVIAAAALLVKLPAKAVAV